MPVPILSFDQVIDRLLASGQPYQSEYLAMYSSWYGGIITDPALMMVPLDDHLVHRGDGIFEVFKTRNWNIYALDRHMERLARSALAYDLKMPAGSDRLVEIIRETIRAGNASTCLVRLFVSRGPGGFSANPYECVSSQLYIIVTAFQPAPAESYEKGVVLRTSSIPAKTENFAQMKNCNYLPNVLMKKEARDAGADFPVSLDERGFLAEGASENVGIVTKSGEFLFPRFLNILRGITITRAAELAQDLIGRELTAVGEADISRAAAYDAAEMFVFGTSIDVLPVVEYDGRKIGTGKPGPVFRALLKLLDEDQSKNGDMLTPVVQ